MTAAGTTTRPIKAEIEATREQLARTVDELSARLDVPARAKESALRARDTAVETYRESPPVVIGGRGDPGGTGGRSGDLAPEACGTRARRSRRKR